MLAKMETTQERCQLRKDGRHNRWQ
jgi:hypothetical protein